MEVDDKTGILIRQHERGTTVDGLGGECRDCGKGEKEGGEERLHGWADAGMADGLMEVFRSVL